jgi:hypothetical protein
VPQLGEACRAEAEGAGRVQKLGRGAVAHAPRRSARGRELLLPPLEQIGQGHLEQGHSSAGL